MVRGGPQQGSIVLVSLNAESTARACSRTWAVAEHRTLSWRSIALFYMSIANRSLCRSVPCCRGHKGRLGKAIAHFCNAAMARAWNRWREYHEREARARRAAERALSHWHNRAAASSWNSWRRAVQWRREAAAAADANAARLATKALRVSGWMTDMRGGVQTYVAWCVSHGGRTLVTRWSHSGVTR
jgi:hypothetical protein